MKQRPRTTPDAVLSRPGAPDQAFQSGVTEAAIEASSASKAFAGNFNEVAGFGEGAATLIVALAFMSVIAAVNFRGVAESVKLKVVLTIAHLDHDTKHNDDDNLRDVRRDQLLPELVRTVEHGLARHDGFDDALRFATAKNGDAIAASDLAFLSARKTGKRQAVGKFDQIVPPVCGGDSSLELQVNGLSSDDKRATRNAAGGCES